MANHYEDGFQYLTAEERKLSRWTRLAYDYRVEMKHRDVPRREVVGDSIDELAKLRKFVLSALESEDARDFALEAYKLAEEIKAKLDETDGNV